MRVALSSACTTAVVLLLQSQALSQAVGTQVADDEDVIEEIIVTGSRIPRRDFFSLSPIVSVDRQEIGLTGDLQVNNVLNSLPQADPGIGSGTGNSFEGSTRVNLRGLGDARTLTLLNGRRYADGNVFGSADLNSLPPILIKRIEIISGGASAVYGSDAIAGAVNFILRNDFDGFDSSLQYGVSDHGDAETLNVDVALGTAVNGGSGHVAAFLSYYDRSVVFQDAREFSRVPRFANNQTGEIEDYGSFDNGAGTIAGIPGVSLYTFDPDGRPRLFIDPDDVFNYAPENALIAPMERWSAGLFGDLELTDKLAVSMEFMFTRSEPTQRRSYSFGGPVIVNTDRPDISPEFRDLLATDYDANGDGIANFFFGRRFTVDRGPVINRNERDFVRAMLELSGALGTNWKWSAYYSYSNTDWLNRTENDISRSRIQQGLLVDPLTGGCFDPSGCVPVNPFGADNLSAAASTFIGLDVSGHDETANEQIVNLSMTGSLLEAWAGPLDVAIGAEYREVDISFEPTESLLTGDSVFYGRSFPLRDKTSVAEAYIEGRLPFAVGAAWAEYLGIEFGGRVSDYDTIGDDVYSWKLGAEWETVPGIRLRAMFQRAIRAPGSESFQEDLFAGVAFGFGPFFDQCSASQDPVGNGLEELCVAQGIPPDQIGVFEASFFPTAIEYTANPDLGAEEADTITAGIVWQVDSPVPTSISLDYFDIEIDDAITLVQPGDALDLCFASRDPEDRFCETFSREPGGNIELAQGRWFNASTAKSEGIDLAVQMNWDAPRLATIGPDAMIALSLVATHYFEVGTQPTPLLPVYDCTGRFGGFCDDFVFLGAMPEFRSNARFTYESGPVSASLRWLYVDSLLNSYNETREATGQQPGILAIPSLPSKSYFDLTLDAELGDRWYLTLGIVNLLDESPPLVADGDVQKANTDPTTYDTLGRRYFLRARFAY